MQFRQLGSVVAALSYLAFLGGAWRAQAADETANAGSSDKLEEVVVTAQKRSEKLQDVPVSVQVIGGATLQQQNYNNLLDVMQSVPGVIVTESIFGGPNNLSIRGVGSGGNPFFDQSVATFYDDIFHGRSKMSGATFVDLDRIEVLKGPQTTFFGNNAIAGALNIVSKKPGDSFDAWGRMLYGQFGQYAVEGAAGGPITDTFGARLAVSRSGGSGWIENVTLGNHVPRVNDEAARLTLVYKPVSDLEATLKIEGSNHTNEGSGFGNPAQITGCPAQAPFSDADVIFCTGFRPLIASGQLPTGLNNNLTANSINNGNSLSTAESALTLNYNRWGHTFTSVTGFYSYHYNIAYGSPGTPGLYNSLLPESYHQVSQEFRVTSPAGGRLEYMAGAYFQSDRLAYSSDLNLIYLGPVIPGQYLGLHTDTTQDERAYSVFGSATWNVAEGLKVSGGLRGSRTNKSYDLNSFTGLTDRFDGFGGIVPQPDFFGPAVAMSGSQTSQALMPSAKVQYQITPAAMAYLSFSKGWKAGGFNGTQSVASPADVPYGPEHVNAYELGLKSKWFDDTVLLDLAVFRSDYTDLQANVNVNSAQCPGGCFFVKNAASSLTEGVELEAQWVASRAFQLSANVSYIDAHYVDYPDGFATPLHTLLTGDAFENLSGTRIPGTPRWSGSINATYSTLVPGDYRVTAELSPFISGNYYQDQFTNFQGAYTRLDARLALESPDRRWGLDLIAKNLTDRVIVVGPPGIIYAWASKEEPRNVAIQVRYKY